MNELEEKYLAHHGILGQKWGRKMGPPYPLGAGDHSANEKKEGYKKSLGGGRNEKLYDRHESSDSKQKNAHSVKAAANRTLAKVYALNEKTYAKSNKTLSSMNSDAKEKFLKKAEEAQKEANKKKSQKEAIKAEKKAAQDERTRRLSEVDPELAKNRQTRKVAEDYHNLSDREFANKYHMGNVFNPGKAKKTFAKRYLKTDGDTYSLGKKKAVAALAFIAMQPESQVTGLNGKKITVTGKKAVANAFANDFGEMIINTYGSDRAQNTYKKVRPGLDILMYK